MVNSLKSRNKSLLASISGLAPQKEEDFPLEFLGTGSDVLKQEILNLYWDGVRAELTTILLNLHRWQTEPSFSEPIPDEAAEDRDLIQGYESFVDHVSRDPRSAGAEVRSSQDAQAAVRDTLLGSHPIGLWQRRALMLLQSAQFLDVDKLFEYRPAGISFGNWTLPIWKKLSPPQLKLSIVRTRPRYLERPLFLPQKCSGCTHPIRSSAYSHLAKPSMILCETCFRKSPERDNGQFRKRYKTCCLPSELTPGNVELLCNCSSPHNDKAGDVESRWPLAIGAEGTCWLFALNRQIAVAKYKGTMEHFFTRISIQDIKDRDERKVRRINRPRRKTGRLITLPNLNSEFGNPVDFDTSPGTAYPIEGVPLYLHTRKKNYPFGNVHVALRFGPLTIENGIRGTKGVTVTTRDCPQLQVSMDAPPTKSSLQLTERNLEAETSKPGTPQTRTVYRQQRKWYIKRYKAMAKQVVGGAFCGFIDRNAEFEVAETLIKECQGLELVGIGSKLKQTLIKQSAERVFEKVHSYLSSRVEKHVSSIVNRLLDPAVALHWHQKENSCQTFCDNIIDTRTFGSLFAPVEDDTLYLMSFVCRSSAYIAQGPGPVYNTPQGLIEEYLLKFRFGRHDDSDVIDTLQEYWYDWGNFEGPLYRYQDVFPWDCTEGFCRNPLRCSECNISRHVWAFPFDSWSMITLHLSRARQFYPQTANPARSGNTEGTADTGGLGRSSQAMGVMSDLEWFRNRLTILMGQYSLLMGAAAMARCPTVRRDTNWIWDESLDKYIDRVKLGGIIRAQPFSHHFEKGAYYHYYVAGWSSLELDKRIEQYEKLRDMRAELGGGLPELARLIQRSREARESPGNLPNDRVLDLAADDSAGPNAADTEKLDSLGVAVHDLSTQTQHECPPGFDNGEGLGGSGGGMSDGGGGSDDTNCGDTNCGDS